MGAAEEAAAAALAVVRGEVVALEPARVPAAPAVEEVRLREDMSSLSSEEAAA